MLNKLMLIPIAFLLILIMFVAVDSGERYTGITDNYSEGSIMFNDSETVYKVPEAKAIKIDLWQITGAVAILIAAVAVGILSGITVFGTGLSDGSQKLIFDALLFGGLWAALSLVILNLITDNALMMVFWMGMTVIYVIGMGAHMGSRS